MKPQVRRAFEAWNSAPAPRLSAEELRWILRQTRRRFPEKKYGPVGASSFVDHALTWTKGYLAGLAAQRKPATRGKKGKPTP